MRNPPWPSTTLAPACGAPFGVTEVIVRPLIDTVLLGMTRPSTTSTTLTRVIASVCVWGLADAAAVIAATAARRQAAVVRTAMKLYAEAVLLPTATSAGRRISSPIR